MLSAMNTSEFRGHAQRIDAFGLGLTNIVARPTRSAADVARQEYEGGRRRLARTIERVKPRVVAFVGVTAYR